MIYTKNPLHLAQKQESDIRTNLGAQNEPQERGAAEEKKLTIEYILDLLEQDDSNGIIKLIQENLFAFSDDSDAQIIAEFALDTGHTNLATFLTGYGADINALDEAGFTQLMLAAQQGRLDLVESLIDAGAELNAAADSMTEIFSITLGLGPINYAKSTALMIAADKGYKDIVESLLDAGADANLINEEGKTALMIAADKGYTDILESLLHAGADANLVNEAGKTALDFATESHRELDDSACINLLQEAMGLVEPMGAAASMGEEY